MGEVARRESSIADMSGASGWLTLESEPAVFHQLIQELGVTGVQVEELYGLDDQSLSAIRPFYGLIFLFRYQGDDRSASSVGCSDGSADVWFARQVIQNACATQAILAILLNNDLVIDIGPELRQFKDFTRHFDPETCGEAMSNSETLRTVHNSFARSEMFYAEDEHSHRDVATESPNHFIAYTVIRDRLYELDGLQPLPIDHGPCMPDNLGSQISHVLAERIRRYDQEESSFCLLALTRDVLASPQAEDPVRVQHELERRAMWRREVAMRRHNFAGCITALCRALAQRSLGKV